MAGIAVGWPPAAGAVTSLVLVDPRCPPAGQLRPMAGGGAFAGLAVPVIATPVVAARMRRMGPRGVVDGTMSLSMRHADRLDADVRSRMVALATERASLGGESPRAYTQAAASLVRYVTGRMRDDLGAVDPDPPVHRTTTDWCPFVRPCRSEPTHWVLRELDVCRHSPSSSAHRAGELIAEWLPRAERSPAATPSHPDPRPSSRGAGRATARRPDAGTARRQRAGGAASEALFSRAGPFNVSPPP